jgi:hypothetical protein
MSAGAERRTLMGQCNRDRSSLALKPSRPASAGLKPRLYGNTSELRGWGSTPRGRDEVPRYGARR